MNIKMKQKVYTNHFCAESVFCYINILEKRCYGDTEHKILVALIQVLL